MDLTEEFIKEHELSENQVSAVKGFIETELVPTIKKEYDGLANENAEGILDGVSKSAREKLGVKIDREKGEKWADYLNRVSDSYFDSKKSELDVRQQEIEDKLKNFKGGDELKKSLEDEKLKNDGLLKKYADYDEIKENADKYQPLLDKYTSTKRQVAYGGVKPSFPKEVNKYEADAKWKAFVDNVDSKYDIEIVDNEAIAIDKENKHKQIKLAELVSKDDILSELVKGRTQGGVGAKEISKVNITDVPFEVPEDAKTDSGKRAIIIREYLASKGIDKLDEKYSNEFRKFNTLIKKG